MTHSLDYPWPQLGGLMFTARRLVDGLYAGRHLSPQRGSGQDFHDYRAYTPGDDLSDLDWKLLGRTDRCYLRRYRRQTDLGVHLMVDGSASMQFAGLDRQGRPLSADAHPTKWQLSATLAAAIAYLSIRQSDRAGLSLFADKLLHHLPAAGTLSHLQQFCQTLEKHQPKPGTGNIAFSLKQAHRLLRKRGLLIVLSDLLDEPSAFFEGISPFRHDGWEVVVLQILTPQEVDLAQLGDQQLQLVDAETRTTVPTRVGQIARDYHQLMQDHLQVIRQGCSARGMDHQLVTTPTPVIEALRHHLARRATVKR